MCASGDVRRSRVNTTAEGGNRDISTPLLLGKCCVGWTNIWLVGVLTRFLPFSLLLRDSSLPILQSRLGLNTVSCGSPPPSGLCLIAVYVWDLEEFCFFLHVVASPKR